MDVVFLNLARGSRLSNYMGLKMHPEHSYRFGSDYSYVEIPLAGIVRDGEEVEKGLRNQQVLIIPACTVDVKAGHKIFVKVNPALQEYGSAPSIMLLDSGLKEQPVFYITLRKDLHKEDITWAVRLYLLP